MAVALPANPSFLDAQVCVPVTSTLGGMELENEYRDLLRVAIEASGQLTDHPATVDEDSTEPALTSYGERLLELRRVGELRRPWVLRDREERLSGAELVGEVAEIFAS